MSYKYPMGIFLGLKAAVALPLGADSLKGIRVALQGCGSVVSGVARLLAGDRAVLTPAETDAERAGALGSQLLPKP